MKDLTAIQKVKWLVLNKAAGYSSCDIKVLPESLTPQELEDLWDVYGENDYIYDAMSEVREGQFQTPLNSPYSRHYESATVAAKLPDGSYVAWTYWYGGGKHACPADYVPWMEDAFDVECEELEEVIITRHFTKKK